MYWKIFFGLTIESPSERYIDLGDRSVVGLMTCKNKILIVNVAFLCFHHTRMVCKNTSIFAQKLKRLELSKGERILLC